METLIRNFYNQIIGIQDISPLVFSFPKIMREQISRRKAKFLEAKCEKGEEENSWKVPASEYHHFVRITNRENGLVAASNFSLDSAFLGMIAKFDAYIGELMKKCIEVRPELMKTLNREVKFCDISSLSTIDQIRAYVIEKEVESTLRKAHIEHIQWFESKLQLSLQADTALISEFIEVTETRNLFAHCDGVVSAQFIENCKEYSVDLSGREIGSRIEMTREYFSKSADVILDIGFKMANIIWRKLSNENIRKSDSLILEMVYDLIDSERYLPAIRIGKHFADKKVTKDEDSYLTLLINLAQAYKWSGNQEWKNILKKEQWNSKSNRYKIGKEALFEEWDSAARTMKTIGSTGEVKQENYECWPLFKQFRETTQFKETYKIIFGKDFEEKRQLTSTLDLLTHNEEGAKENDLDDGNSDGDGD